VHLLNRGGGGGVPHIPTAFIASHTKKVNLLACLARTVSKTCPQACLLPLFSPNQRPLQRPFNACCFICSLRHESQACPAHPANHVFHTLATLLQDACTTRKNCGAPRRGNGCVFHSVPFPSSTIPWSSTCAYNLFAPPPQFSGCSSFLGPMMWPVTTFAAITGGSPKLGWVGYVQMGKIAPKDEM
jgi:hypothetical protein